MIFLFICLYKICGRNSLYLHLLFHTLQQSSRFTFDAEWNAPLPTNGRANETANGRADETANGRANETANGGAYETANGGADETANGRANETANGRANTVRKSGTAIGK